MVTAGIFVDFFGKPAATARGPALFALRADAPLWLGVAFYQGPSATLVLSWGLYVLCITSGDLVVRAFSAELFPTSHRGTSSGWLVLVQSIGWVTGLFLVGFGADDLDDLGATVTWVTLATVVAGFAVLRLPETRRVELEALSESPAAERD